MLRLGQAPGWRAGSWVIVVCAGSLAGCMGEIEDLEPGDAAPDDGGALAVDAGATDARGAPDGAVLLDAGPADAAPPDPDAPPGIPTKRVLTFEWQHQETGYWCGPASTRIALSTRMASPPSQSTLAAYLGTTTAGTDHIGLVVGALNHYLGTSWFNDVWISDPPTQAQQDKLKQDIRTIIGRDGYGMVANIVAGWRPPFYPSGTIYHYVAVVGYDAGGDKVLIADPAGEGSGEWADVPRTYWIDTVDLGVWIGLKGYTGR